MLVLRIGYCVSRELFRRWRLNTLVRNEVVLMNKLFLTLAAVLAFLGCEISSQVSEKSKPSQQQAVAGKAIAQKDSKPKQGTAGTEESNNKGPTVYLFGKDGEFPDNKLADFMYFVPLISPVLVSAVTSQNNTQGGHLLSYESDQSKDSFNVACEFRMKGEGSYLNEFDSDAMIEWNMKSAGGKTVLKNILNYIKFEGEGYGRIEARGTIAGSKMTVEDVDVHFDARGAESPVTIGLYDTDISKKSGGSYIRYNYKVARITTLSFERSEGAPKLGIKIAAVGSSEGTLGVWAHIKGFFGNFFIDPIEIDRLGNDTMLEFGLGLYNKEAKFTFPKAKNLKVKE